MECSWWVAEVVADLVFSELTPALIENQPTTLGKS